MYIYLTAFVPSQLHLVINWSQHVRSIFLSAVFNATLDRHLLAILRTSVIIINVTTYISEYAILILEYEQWIIIISY